MSMERRPTAGSPTRGEGNRPPAAGPLPFGRGPMGMPVQKAKDFKGTLKRFLGYLAPQKYRLIVVLSASIISTVFGILSPKILGLATTKLVEGVLAKFQKIPGAKVDFEYIGNILLILAGLYIVSSIFSFVQQFIMAGVAQRTVYVLRQQVEGKLARLPLKFFDSHSHGDIMSRAVNDMDNIGSTLQQSLTQMIMSAVTIVGVIVMMLSISLWLTIVVVLSLPLSMLVTTLVAKRSQNHFKVQQRSLGQLNGHVEEMYTGHRIVKAFGHEDEAISEFNTLNDKLYEAGWRAQFISGIIMPLMLFVGNVAYVLVSVIGGIMVAQRALAIGDIQAFIQYTGQFSWPITQLANLANVIQSTMASAERIFELLDEPEQVAEAVQPVSIAAPKGAVTFEHVNFSYKPDSPLIEDMNIQVEPGNMVAIVGPTGAGKTTLVNLLMRFYELDSGRILVDGVDITQLKRADLRRMFGMVLQDTWLFNGTIRDNIAYGREGATEEEIVQAAKMAQADHFIRTLPDSYNTILNEEASNISQGQKQLLTIARAILANPAILILDEATSSVDTRTEILIQKAMNSLMKGRTSFVIAHRLSTIRDANLILVMNQGKIIETGNHQELLAQGGFYADLYNSQFTATPAVKPA